jgi:hypothetical protein
MSSGSFQTICSVIGGFRKIFNATCGFFGTIFGVIGGFLYAPTNKKNRVSGISKSFNEASRNFILVFSSKKQKKSLMPIIKALADF